MKNIGLLGVLLGLAIFSGCEGCGGNGVTEPNPIEGCITVSDCLENEDCINNVCTPNTGNLFEDAGQPDSEPEIDAGAEPETDAGPVVDPRDVDNDGLTNDVDDDDDNDGLTDIQEQEFGTDCSTSSQYSADTDQDGILDPQDPYPYDPWPEFMVRQTDDSRIELFLSNRDGSFEDAVLIGDQLYGDADNDGEEEFLEYRDFTIGDFDHNGKIDFLARTSAINENGDRQVWFFTRDIKRDEFEQRLLGVTGGGSWAIVLDADEDTYFDLAVLKIIRNSAGMIDTTELQIYLNNHNPDANCFAEEADTTNCFFRKLPDMSLSGVAANQWNLRFAKQAVNLNPSEDDHLDITVDTYNSGSAVASPTYTLFGNGDGTFQEPVLRFTHAGNLGPGNSILFADFNSDDIGDIIIGFDDDGSPGSAWFYAGQADGTLSTTPIEAVDLNPTDMREVGGDNEFLGRTSSGRTFDFDFDGNYDLIIGYDHENYNTDNLGQTRLYFGNGDGTFDPAFILVGEESLYEHRFSVPQKLCPTYELNASAASSMDGGTP